jgi:hypothetical protein
MSREFLELVGRIPTNAAITDMEDSTIAWDFIQQLIELLNAVCISYKVEVVVW